MRFWPFSKSIGQRNREEADEAARASEHRQHQQIGESVQRISADGRRRVEEAQAQLTEAAEGVKTAIGVRVAESSQLRDALLTLIDRESGGIFDLRKRGR